VTPTPGPAPAPEVAALVSEAYAAFNARDVDRALAAMAPDVEWPNGWEGGWVRGRDEVRAYWERQWAEIDPTVVPGTMTPTPDGRVAVEVAQTVRGLDGTVLAEGRVVHVHTIDDGLITRMEIVGGTD